MPDAKFGQLVDVCRHLGRRAGHEEAAAALDTGDASTGKQSNAIDRYQCPRCSGDMVRVVDPKQTHIWYETCGSCNGSFLDAGELRDISAVSIADFFRDLVTPERK